MSAPVKLKTLVAGKWVAEQWIPCRQFADEIGRPYTTVLFWFRKKWITALELGMGKYYVCITPVVRAKREYRALLKSGKLRTSPTNPRVKTGTR